ncbi:PEP-CTERM-box response regulator transcription factor [Sphingomonas montanisoli]|uniref:PEP-CTERM-box response regulator transcription factor n=1 Tax=Sphingomonas montanisoli TaxID=2606412 RepID=A0A5D9CDB7_9SPHN|nr:PEP-CTERM-box response regulator transcription factor [Sphingomonas montanisoli]TZG28105.1 PEP-CTERM-box response regulator transcription factor [Sphingomonas montanisoli]
MLPKKPILLVVEDDEGLQRQLRWAYEDYEVVIAGDRKTAIDALRANEPAVVTLDLGLPPDPDGTSEGFAILETILSLKPDTKVIVASGHGAHEGALRAVAMGAYDYYHKPVDFDELGLIVKRAFELASLEQENARMAAEQAGEGNPGGFITADPVVLKALKTIQRVAVTDVSVLLLGASGTGKEVLARGLHQASPRREGHFVAINCAAIPDTLLEAELFGYEKGAFTGAVRTAEGKIELAQGGTLFLDEIGDVPLSLQVKLLRFLQERVIERIGGRKAIEVDTRIVAATHQDLPAMIADGRFREDLYYRLAEIVVTIPPLADRPGDAVLIARQQIKRYARELNPQLRGFTPEAIAALDAWSWPGNVRELENRLKRAAIMAEGKMVTADDLDLSPGREDGGFLNLRAAREQADRTAITRAVARAEGNISNAAKLLGISRPTLYDLLKQYGISA